MPDTNNARREIELFRMRRDLRYSHRELYYRAIRESLATAKPGALDVTEGAYRSWQWAINGPEWSVNTSHVNKYRHAGAGCSTPFKHFGKAIAQVHALWRKMDERKRTPETLFIGLHKECLGFEEACVELAGCNDAWQMFRRLQPDAFEHARCMWNWLQNLESEAGCGNPWRHENWMAYSPYKDLHGLHVSEVDPNMLAYARTLKHGAHNQWVRIKPGRYLQQFFSDVLSESDIRRITEKFLARNKALPLQFIEHDDPEGWKRVYEEGPDSCMSGEMSDCVRVYAHRHSVLRLAYQQKDDGTIVSRAIVREDTNPPTWVRCYPNPDGDDLLRTQRGLMIALEQAGYVQGNLNGALLRIIDGPEDNSYIMPYLDHGSGGGQCVTRTYRHNAYYWEVSHHGLAATSTDGWITEGEPCACCEEYYQELTRTMSGDSVCESCLENHYTYAYVDGGEQEYVNSDYVVEVDGDWYHERALSYYDIVSAIGRRGREVYAKEDDCVYVGSQWYVKNYAEDNDVHLCVLTDTYLHEDDMVQVGPDGEWVDASHDDVVELAKPCNGYVYAIKA